MDQVGVRELRLNASRYLERVEAGESIEVTKRGRVIALISPSPHGNEGLDYLIATGQVIPGEGNLLDVEPRTTTRGSVSQALADLRADER